ncbi:MAG: FtsW/RodA/SpoVE family cell cycle protein [Planctomycetota bacterium JB042]
MSHAEECTVEGPLEGTARSLQGVVLFLLLLGAVMIYSTRAPGAALDGGFAAAWGPLLQQGAKVLVGVLLFALGASLSPRRLLRHADLLLLLAFVLLALVWIPGVGAKINGARRWFSFGPGFQPVELARVALIVWLAARLDRIGPGVKDFARGLLPTAAVPGVLAVLLLLQPDFGSALFFVGLSSLLLILAGARVTHFAGMLLVALPILIGYAATSLGHVQRRIDQFLSADLGHQAKQSLLALGSGGLTGVDLGAGMSKLGYLPMVSSDFILAAIGEELGFVGTSLVILSFLLFTILGARVAFAQRSIGTFVLAAGLTLSIAMQAIVNVAVVTAAVPTKGIALPFLSAGGSSLALSLFAVGVLVRLARTPEEAAPAELPDVGTERPVGPERPEVPRHG